MKKKYLTIQDIALALNISAATVSRALHKDRRISKKVQERVQKYAREHHYMPNGMAVALRLRGTRLVGVVVPSFTDPAFAHVLSGIESAASKAGYRLIAAQSHDDEDRERRIVKAFTEEQVMGAISIPGRETRSYQAYRPLRDNDIPAVFYDRQCSALYTDRVVTSNGAGLFAAMDRVIQRGNLTPETADQLLRTAGQDSETVGQNAFWLLAQCIIREARLDKVMEKAKTFRRRTARDADSANPSGAALPSEESEANPHGADFPSENRNPDPYGPDFPNGDRDPDPYGPEPFSDDGNPDPYAADNLNP